MKVHHTCLPPTLQKEQGNYGKSVDNRGGGIEEGWGGVTYQGKPIPTCLLKAGDRMTIL